MTNHWIDIKNADLILIMGGNAAEAHPCGFKWVTEAKAHRKAKLVVVDPRFTRSAAVADYYAPLRSGTDIAFLGGVINYLVTHDKILHEYVKPYTNATYLVNPKFSFADGMFSGYDAEHRRYDTETWSYQLDADGYAKIDETMQDPNCVFQLMKKHFSRYTPEMVSRITGTPEKQFLTICEMIGTTAVPDRTMTSLYALGWTQHSVGSENIRCMAMIQLLLGNIGVAGGGINALRGHSNVQGITDMGLFGESLPGYMTLPTEQDATFGGYIKKWIPKPLRPNQMNYWSNYPKFFVSLMKAWYGKAATKENDFGFDWLPKLEGPSDALAIFERMHQGKITGFFCQGYNPLAAVANKKKVGMALARLKYLVVIDPLATETSEFWKNHGVLNDVDPGAIQTEVFRLPSTLFAEEEGSYTSSGRVIQWHWKAADGPGESKGDVEIVASIFIKLREMYAKKGGAYPEPVLQLSWPYRIADQPSSEELAREISGRSLVGDGEQLTGFAQLRDDGTTACGNWLYGGMWSPAGNLAARRDNSDPSGLGQTLNWGFAWPANRRILYNRASCNLAGRPWDPSRLVIEWNGSKWVGNDIPDMRPDARPEEMVMPFIMQQEGVGRLFALGKMKDGPFPEHYEPFESPLAKNPMHPDNPETKCNPAVRIFMGDLDAFGKPDKFPYVGTTYRLTEHYHYWTKHSKINAILQPEQFVEIGEELAMEKGISSGSQVTVSSNRGFIKAVAVVTKRIKALDVDGRKVHTVGIPIHWGFMGVAKNGYLTNTLTPYVGDATAQTPEFKAFLVNIEKA